MKVTLTVILVKVVTSVCVPFPWGLERHRPFAMVNPTSHRYTFSSLSFCCVSQPQLATLRNLESFAIPIQILSDDVELLHVPHIDVSDDAKSGVDEVNRGVRENVFAPAECAHARYSIGCNIGANGRCEVA
jgi:hypothetical protein